MFVFNFKINKKIFMRVFKIAVFICALAVLILSVFTIFKSPNTARTNDDNYSENCINLSSNNYTNFLKECHEDISRYEGKLISTVGYVYRLSDFSDSQFVLARTMLLNSNSQAVVVGILCEYASSKDFEDYEWVEVKGTVEKGNYHGDLPILKIKEIKKSKAPEDEFVYEPVD